MRLANPLPIIAWGGLVITQLVSPDKAWMSLLAGLGALILIAWVWARALRDGVTADRHTLGTWVIAGDRLRERWTLANHAWLPVLWARISDRSDVPGYRVDRVETAPSNGERIWTTTGVCQRRGVFHLGPWSVEMSDPLGFFRIQHTFPAATTIMVYPRASFLPNLDLPRGRSAGRAASSERSFEDTVQISSLRPYVQGDPLRRVAWRASAHRADTVHSDLLVHEYDREPSGDLWLILDLDAEVQAGSDAEATQEYAVILAASLAAQYLRQGERRAVGLLVSGRTPVLIQPARGESQLWRILETLAEVQPAAGVPFAALLEQARETFGSGRTLLLITPSFDPAWVAAVLPLVARGDTPSVLLLDATTFDPPRGTAESLDGLRALLAQQRIPATMLEQGFPFRPVERIRRERTEHKTLGGFGRVIEVQVEEEV
jgi:uncharacterized protein (DUF58 family)